MSNSTPASGGNPPSTSTPTTPQQHRNNSGAIMTNNTTSSLRTISPSNSTSRMKKLTSSTNGTKHATIATPPKSSHGNSNSNTSPSSIKSPGSISSATMNAGSGNNVLPTSATSSSSAPTGTRSRSRSLTQPHSGVHSINTQYLAQEKAYLRKIRNQFVDDYYTKGISGANEYLRDFSNDRELGGKRKRNNEIYDDNEEYEYGEEEDEEDEDDDEEVDFDTSNETINDNNASLLLVDMDDHEKDQIDYSLALSLMKNTNLNNISNNKSNKSKPLSRLSKDDTDDPAVIERLEWQSMLTAVLTGDVVRSEKTKIINNSNPDSSQESYIHATFKDSLWFGINAKLFNRTEDDQRKIIAYRRTLVDQLIEDVMKFEINYQEPVRNQVETILSRYDESCSLWKTLEDMRNDKPACRSIEFQNRIDALTAWLSITDAIMRETKSLKLWIGNDELDVTKSPVEPLSSGSSTSSGGKLMKKIFDEDNKSLAERLMKEKDVHTIFRKRIFKPISPWMIKSKDTYIRLGTIFETLKLPDYIHDLIEICIIPMKLIKEIINVRLSYAMKLHNPTLMMIDQMIDDFKSYITIALEVKTGILEYIKTDELRNWILTDLFDNEITDFDTVVLRCVRYFLILLNRKLLDSSRSPTTFRTFKEPDELEEAWEFLQPLGFHIDGGSVVVAEQITLLTLKLIHRLLAYFNTQIRSPPNGTQDLMRWYSSTTENFGQLRRKLARFTGGISRDFTNSLVFDIPNLSLNNNTKTLLEILKSSNHFLVYTGTLETQGTYFFASPDLLGKELEILKLINGSYIGLNNKRLPDFSNLLNLITVNSENSINSGDDDSREDLDRLDMNAYYSYVVALCPLKPIVWEGPVVNVTVDSVPITDVKNGQLLLITRLPYFELHIIRDHFLDLMNEVFMIPGGMKPIEQRCSLAKVHHELTRTNKTFFKMGLAVLDSVKIVKEKVKKLNPREGEYQTLINNLFIYARDYGKNTIRNLDSSRKSTIIMKLIQLSIDWVSFICDDCIHTDRKTFRWCVLALEFAMDMTRGFNVLVLNEAQFYKLKAKVARCMSLLISHFDIMGARSSEAEKNKLLKWTSQRHQQGIGNSEDDEYIAKVYHEELMSHINEIEEYRRDLQEQLLSVGRVLDVTDLEYQFVTLLASSFSSVSIRWQKGRFIGGGTFGQVFSAVNLDTGGVMAVKEIRFHDSQSIKNIVPSIKEEMNVLEILNHPNVVQYFGVEVHRDKVYIFMEYCEGGSLSGLLTHGRIEDEMVIQVYTLQMLEGLAYLHQSGVVHRDIKPENILLDHNGVIKFVDFGAAKVIANTGRTRGGSGMATKSLRTSLADPHNPGNNNHLNSMTGTPMYMSPEAITGTSSPAIDRSGVIDIWSLGCCVLEMATGRRPWANLDNEWAIMYHIAAGHKPPLPSPDQLSDGGRNFVARCLEHDPMKRPSAVELLSDPWMVSIRQLAFGTGSGDMLSSTPSSETGGLIETMN